MINSLSFKRVEQPTTWQTGDLENDCTVVAQPEIFQLASVWGSTVFCAPPIPGRLQGIAHTFLPKEILDLNHGIRDLSNVLPLIDLKERFKVIEETIFEKKSPWTGYVVYAFKPLKLSGMTSFVRGFSPIDNSEIEGSYQASRAEIMLSVEIDVNDEALFEEIVVVMLVLAKFFIDQRRKFEERDVTRIVMPFASKESIESLLMFQELFQSRLEVLRKIFGLPFGTIPKGSVRNPESLDQEVWGVDVDRLNVLIDGYFSKNKGKKEFFPFR